MRDKHEVWDKRRICFIANTRGQERHQPVAALQRTDSHLVSACFRSGWETNRCHTTA
jgi:hypothetical protein